MGSEEIRTDGMLDKKALCSIYIPIRWSKNDTRFTQEQVVAANKIWIKLCKS